MCVVSAGVLSAGCEATIDRHTRVLHLSTFNVFHEIKYAASCCYSNEGTPTSQPAKINPNIKLRESLSLSPTANTQIRRATVVQLIHSIKLRRN